MILVTGGTGTLGSDLIPELRSRGEAPIILSRRPGPHTRVGDLSTGSGLDVALAGVDTVIHLAVGRDQEAEARRLVDACSRAGIKHLVFISIPGIEHIPFAYYKAKLAAERVIAAGPVPTSILRATQFHPFVVNTLFARQGSLPVVFAPRFSMQPIDTRTVAARLADLALGEPQGRVADLAGPETLTGRQLAEQWSLARFGRRKRVIEFSLFGKVWAGYAAGHLCVATPGTQGRTFAGFLAS